MAQPPALRDVLARKQRKTVRSNDVRPNRKVPVKLIDELTNGVDQFTILQEDSLTQRGTYKSRLWQIASAIGDTSAGKAIIGEMFSDMFIGKINLPDEWRWVPVKPLGNGSYGAAALFKHMNWADNTDDATPDMVPGWGADMSMEAAIMMQLNELGSDGVLFLRDFKTFKNNEYHCYYLEYCPNLDLEQLRMTHKAMQRKIPDPLLWYFFYTLAKGLAAMEEGPFGDYKTPHTRVGGAFLLHRDMKPANTFVGYPAAPDQPPGVNDSGFLGNQLEYPVAKIADFGLSRIMTLADEDNIARNHWGVGSPPWVPPEMRGDRLSQNRSRYYAFVADRYDSDGAPLSSSQPSANKLEHAYTPAGNMFVLGYIMYQLITLDEVEDMHFYLNDMVSEPGPVFPVTFDRAHLQATQSEFNRFRLQEQLGYGLTDAQSNRRAALRGRLKMLTQWHNLPMDPLMKQLVENCMSFLPQNRSTARDLVGTIEWTMPNLASSLQRLRSTNPQAFDETTRAYTAEVDLPGMPVGTFVIERDELFWRRLVKNFKWFDANGGGLRPPMNMSDPRIPQEAKDLFYPGWREPPNRALVRSLTRSFASRVIRAAGGRPGAAGRTSPYDRP